MSAALANARSSARLLLAKAFRQYRFHFLSLLVIAYLVLMPCVSAMAQTPHQSGGSLSNSRFEWPSQEDVWRLVSLQDYNTRIVLLGTMLLGLSSGLIGTFMLLRKRSLVGDVVSHAALPGIAVAFLTMEIVSPGSGRSLVGLLVGAWIAGFLGVAATVAIHRWTRIKEDAALAIVLSIFFGIGIALFTVVQNMPTGNAAGLHNFIYGKAASMVASDIRLIAQGAVVVAVVCVLLFKELKLLCFDEAFAAAQGWPVGTLDLALMALVVSVTVIGFQSVGLLLVVALLIVPPAAARFWTDHLGAMAVVAALLGGLSSLVGVAMSALFPRLAAGAVIVLVGAGFFTLSMFCGRKRGILPRMYQHWKVRRRVGEHDLLRAMFECVEPVIAAAGESLPGAYSRHSCDFATLLAMRSWTPHRLRTLIAHALRKHLLQMDPSGTGYRFTGSGAVRAERAVRNHRLWELYLIHYADVAPSLVDRNADQIEHVLDPETVRQLDGLLAKKYPVIVPPSPHLIESHTDP